MDLIQLKMPPDKAELVAGAIETYIHDNPDDSAVPDLTEILAWLRYRISRWNARHPHTPAA